LEHVYFETLLISRVLLIAIENGGTVPDPELILLVEDNEDHALLIRRAFWKGTPISPLQVVTSGEEAIEYLQGAGRYSNWAEFPLPTVAVLDLKLPGIDGFEVLRWIRKQHGLRALRVVVMTCSELDQDVNLAYQLGANSFIVKPVALEDLIQMIEVSRRYWLRFDKAPEVFRAGTTTDGRGKV
jgi:CheY-like chemotaxis protein